MDHTMKALAHVQCYRPAGFAVISLSGPRHRSGFTLVARLALMILLTLITVGVPVAKSCPDNRQDAASIHI